MPQLMGMAAAGVGVGERELPMALAMALGLAMPPVVPMMAIHIVLLTHQVWTMHLRRLQGRLRAQSVSMALAVLPMAVHLVASHPLAEMVRAQAVVDGKVMTHPRRGMEQGVRLAMAMGTLVIFIVMGLPMQMEEAEAVAMEEVSAMVWGLVKDQEVEKARGITTDHMVIAMQTAMVAEVDAVVGVTVGLAMVLVVGKVAVRALHGTTVMAITTEHSLKMLFL